MFKFIMSILAIGFPWLVLLIYDNPIGAVMALVLQATIIGWIPASIWAWRVVHSPPNKREDSIDEEEEKE